MKTLLKVSGLLLVLLVATALLVPMFISMDDVTSSITRQIEETWCWGHRLLLLLLGGM